MQVGGRGWRQSRRPAAGRQAGVSVAGPVEAFLTEQRAGGATTVPGRCGPGTWRDHRFGFRILDLRANLPLT